MSAELSSPWPTGHSRSVSRDVDAWEIVRPAATGGLRGINMAGFRIPDAVPLDLRAIPHPAVTVVIDFSDRSLQQSIAAGMATSPVDVRADGVECVQVRLSPGQARAALGMPLGQLQGQLVPLDDLWGADAARLREQLHDARIWTDRFDVTTMHLRQRMVTGVRLDPEIAEAWQLIVRSHGQLRSSEVAGALGWSRQRLWSRFGEQVGVTPKRAAMLVRFDRAMRRLLAGESQSAVAASAGYADQSHLHREIREFTETPLAAATSEPWLAADAYAWPTGSR